MLMITDRIFIGCLALSMAVHLIAFLGIPLIRKNGLPRSQNFQIEVTYLSEVPEKTKINGVKKGSVNKPSGPERPQTSPEARQSLSGNKPSEIAVQRLEDIVVSTEVEKKINIDKNTTQIASLNKPVVRPEVSQTVPVINLEQLSNSDEFMDYYESIRAKIKNIVLYPPEARTRRIEGVARLRFSITMTGELIGVSLIDSTRNDYLDRAALRSIKEAAPFPPFPEGLKSNFNRISFNTEISFQLSK